MNKNFSTIEIYRQAIFFGGGGAAAPHAFLFFAKTPLAVRETRSWTENDVLYEMNADCTERKC